MRIPGAYTFSSLRSNPSQSHLNTRTEDKPLKLLRIFVTPENPSVVFLI